MISVTPATRAPVPSCFSLQMVRDAVVGTRMPCSAVSVAPSQRIRFTVPLTSMRLEIVTFSVTAYQLPSVQFLVLLSALTHSCSPISAPFSST